jgi:hypothetical protein
MYSTKTQREKNIYTSRLDVADDDVDFIVSDLLVATSKQQKNTHQIFIKIFEKEYSRIICD